jgi:hypothetical protein
MNMMHSEAVLSRPAEARSPVRERVTNLTTWRRENNVLDTITLVFGGVHYGTLTVTTPYASDKPIVLYVVPSARGSYEDGELRGHVDCLITDDPALGADRDALR